MNSVCIPYGNAQAISHAALPGCAGMVQAGS